MTRNTRDGRESTIVLQRVKRRGFLCFIKKYTVYAVNQMLVTDNGDHLSIVKVLSLTRQAYVCQTSMVVLE